MSFFDSCYRCIGALGLNYLEWRTKKDDFVGQERLGRGEWQEDTIKNPLWFHAASVGELLGVSPLITRSRQEFTFPQLLTTTSRTGRATARDKGINESAKLLPFDHPKTVRAIVRRLEPRAVVIAETELWPVLFAELSAANVPILLVNGRISDRSWPNYRRFRRLIAKTLEQIHCVLVQSSLDAERFAELGVATQRIRVSGSTKFDVPLVPLSQIEIEQIRARCGLDKQAPTIVLGSVRKEELDQIGEVVLMVRKVHPAAQWIIAPRHPEYFTEAGEVLSSRGIQFSRWSNLQRVELPLLERSSGQVILLDTLGDLAKFYQLGDVAFVGGSLVSTGGGHSPIEPALLGLPVIMGSSNYSMPGLVLELKTAGGLIEVLNSQELVAALQRLIANPEERALRGGAAKKVCEAHLGATARALAVLHELLDDH